MPYDVVIIGAGPAGLAAAARLAHFGRRVCVLERQRQPGGLNTFYTRGGIQYDAGLHALTNWPRAGAPRSPWRFLMRQLRLRDAAFDPQPQTFSEIHFPGAALRFTNDPHFLDEQVASRFPKQADRFQRFIAQLPGYDALPPYGAATARAVLDGAFGHSRLADLLLWPALCYGAATEDDMDYGLFVALFRSIFLEGLWRPRGGICPLLEALVRRLESAGGELRLGTGVNEIGAGRPDSVARVKLDSGEAIEAGAVLSSAGCRETLELCGARQEAATIPMSGISFFESIGFLREGTKGTKGTERREGTSGAGNARGPEMGIKAAPELAAPGEAPSIIFFHGPEEFAFRRPAGAVDFERGVACFPDRFGAADSKGVSRAGAPEAERGAVIRLTHLANYDLWKSFSPEEYRARKQEAFARSVASAARFAPELRAGLKPGDSFTPLTIARYTARAAGAVYGSPVKRADGATPFPGVFLIGADQGGVGVVGALLSGVLMANRLLGERRGER